MLDAGRPPSILHLTAGSDAGGLSRYILDLSTAMIARGHRVAVAGDVGVWQARFDAAGIEYLRIPLKGGPVGVMKAIRAARGFVAQRGGFDVYHAHYRRAAMLGRYLKKQAPAPLLYTVHLSHIDLRWYRRLLTDFGDFTHFASVDALAWAEAQRLCDPERSRVIPHGIDLSTYRRPTELQRSAARTIFSVPAGSRMAAFVGRLDDPKNVDWLLDAAAAWDERVHGKLVLLIAGDGPHRQRLMARIRHERLADRVRLLGEIDPLPVYHAADALLLASAREGFSYVCAEAMACGVPVLRTRTSGTTETVLEGITGRAVDIDHEAFVRSAVAFVAQDLDTLRRMGQAAAEHAAQQFGLDRQIQQTIDLYAEMRDRWQRERGQIP